MTAPGNSALVISLMAVFVACAAYAIGRLHQRRQTDRDREDAYREGYDNAARRTFSLAAHLVARRRAARPVGAPLADAPLADAGLGVAAPAEPDPDEATLPLPPAVPPLASPLPAASVSPESFQPASPQLASPLPATPRPNSPSPVPLRPPARRMSAASEHNPTSLGFPVPPPPPPQLIGEPAAVGGVVYRPFPDPRLVGDSEPLPADRGSGPAPSGRHTVPDELVHSATYRLPADRVFRARVPESPDRPALPEEPTTRIWVPKPRQS